MNAPSAYDARWSSTPVSTRMPSSTKTSASSAAASGSSAGDQPRPVLHDGHPDAEPGEHLRQLAADRAAADHDERARQLGDAARRRGWSSTACPPSPSTGGTAGRVPGLSTTPRRAV